MIKQVYYSSIAKAYVQMIRNAEDFIYIENQYFMGSAYAWSSDAETNCHHVIPAEIAQKIVDKIHSGQRFVAYILIPMFPEGDPSSAPIQVLVNEGPLKVTQRPKNHMHSSLNFPPTNRLLTGNSALAIQYHDNDVSKSGPSFERCWR